MHSEKVDETLSMRPTVMHEMFTGSEIEPAWNIEQVCRVAPQYAMRLALGAMYTENPDGQVGFVKLTFEKSSYVMPQENWKYVWGIYEDFMVSYVERNGFPQDAAYLRNRPNLIIEGLRFMEARGYERREFPVESVKVYWLVPDEWACGFYRARLPAEWAKECGLVVDAFTYCNYAQMAAYDVFVTHRTPNAATTQVFQRLAAEGRIIVYECDDDIFNIPNWSIVQSRFTQEEFNKAITARDAADFCFTTTEPLRQSMGAAKTTVLENLMKPSVFREPPQRKTKKFSKKFMGYKTVNEKGEIRLKHRKTGHYLRTDNIVLEEEYNPIVIAWYGSNTHDGDVTQLVPVVRAIGEKYGMAVRFCFFGYCPPDFINATMMHGNVNPSFEIKEEYSHFIDHIKPVEFKNFHSVLHAIGPDIGLCPLVDHQFNKAKSNIKPLEFGCMSVPSVCNDYGPYQFIEHGVNGLKVPIGDTKAWVEALETLIEDDELRRNMGDTIYEYAATDYSWEFDNVRRESYTKFFKRIEEEALLRRKQRTEKLQAIVASNAAWNCGES